MAKVGYIGLGLMGAPMARNLLKAGHTLIVHNRSRAIVNELTSEGAVPATSPREVAEQSDFVFTNLPDSPDVEQVALGTDGIIEGAHEGLIFIDNSTIKPETARKVAAELERVGVMALDAPVSGGDIGAKAGTLTIMVGGKKEAFDKALPLFQVLGKTITYIGESGAGQVAKVANQVIVIGTLVAISEALVLAKKCGVDPEVVVGAIRGGACQSWLLEHKGTKMLSRDFTPGFKGHMQAKDIKIAVDTGYTHHVPMPQTAIGLQLCELLISMGNGELDNSAIVTALESLAAITLDA